VVVVLHDYFLLCPDWNLLHADGFACGEAKADADHARCIDCLGRRLQSRPGARAPELRAWLRQRAELVRAVLERADALVAPSSFVRAQFTRAWGEGVGGRIRVIPHGTLAHPFEPAHAPHDELRVAFVGNATKFKGIDTFVAAAHRLSARRVRFSVLGGLPPGHGLRASGNLELCGPYVPRELSRLLQDVDVVVIGSVVHETYCYTLDEAYRAGTPVIATAMGAIQERVVEGQTGLLVPPGDEEALVDAIDRLDRDRGLLARMRRNVGALRLRSVADMVAEYRQLYEELASSGREIDTVRRAMQARSAETPPPPFTLGEYAAAHATVIALPLMPEGGTVRTTGRKDPKVR
jgi:glycosyltransferase involved in cell wall biosynthesis